MNSFYASGWEDCSTSYLHHTQTISYKIQSVVAEGTMVTAVLSSDLSKLFEVVTFGELIVVGS